MAKDTYLGPYRTTREFKDRLDGLAASQETNSTALIMAALANSYPQLFGPNWRDMLLELLDVVEDAQRQGLDGGRTRLAILNWVELTRQKHGTEE